MINKIIGERMKMLRKSLNLTQKQFAYYIPGKVDYSYIGKIERGHQYPSIKFLEKVARNYGVMVGYFLQTVNPSVSEIEIRIRVRDAARAWRLRTQDMLTPSIQELDDVIMAAFNDSTNSTIKTGKVR